jgi:hypothetical protein
VDLEGDLDHHLTGVGEDFQDVLSDFLVLGWERSVVEVQKYDGPGFEALLDFHLAFLN